MNSLTIIVVFVSFCGALATEKRADNIGTHCLDSGDCFCDKHQVPFCDQHHQCACRDAAAVGRQAVECANDADCFTLCHNNHGTCTHQHTCVCHARQAVECTHDADCFTVCHNNHGSCTNQHTCLCHAKRANNIGDHCVDAAACFCDHHDIPTCVNHQCGCTPH